MPRADLLISLVKAGSEGNNELFRKTAEAIIAEERAKHHNPLADRLVACLNSKSSTPRPARAYDGEQNGPTLFYEMRPRRQLSSIILPDEVQQACRDLIEEQHRADLLRSHCIEPRHRILLSGPPGNGKTTLAETIAYELAVPMYVVRYESIIGSYLGETAVRLSKLFSQARTEHCVLFFDEFDAIGKERGDIHETGEIKRVVSSLLLQVDQLPSHVVLVTATNHGELLDRAAWRRFELRLELPKPTLAKRAEWLQRFESRTGLSFGRSLNSLAKDLGAISFAELELFALDVHRRYVLSIPDGDIRSIVGERMKQWRARVKPATGSKEEINE